MSKVSILLVCMGNICRSPLAEAVLRVMGERAGLGRRLEIDSAGTHGYHIGDAPDARACTVAQRRGYDLSPLRARQVNELDFIHFDHILAMDRENLRLLQRACPIEYRGKLCLFLEYAVNRNDKEVPDPYYGGASGFEQVLDLVEDASRGLLQSILARK